MSTDYTGNPTATQAPSPTPGAGVAPIVRLPSGPDGFSVSVFFQALKTLADFVASINGPRGGGEIIYDHFTGAAVDADVWAIGGGTPIVDDASNGGSGVAQLDVSGGGSIGVRTTELALGTHDCIVKFRARVTGAIGGTCQMTIGLAFSTNTLQFLILGSSSTTNWRALINNVVTVPNGTAVAINSAYKVFEIGLVGGTATFKVDGTAFHTAAYSTNLDRTMLQIAAGQSGILWVDWISLQDLSMAR